MPSSPGPDRPEREPRQGRPHRPPTREGVLDYLRGALPGYAALPSPADERAQRYPVDPDMHLADAHRNPPI